MSCLNVTPAPVIRTYLDICKDVPPMPTLGIGKTEVGEQFRGVVFAAVGTFSGTVEFRGGVAVNIQQPVLHKMALSMGASFFKNVSNVVHPESNGFFCIVPSQQTLESLLAALGSGTNKRFEDSTKGPWQYVLPDFLVESYTQQTLLDPEPFLLHTTRVLKKRKFVLISRLLSRQQSPETNNYISAISAYRKNKKRKNDLDAVPTTGFKKRLRGVLVSRSNMASSKPPHAIAFNRFRRELFDKENQAIKLQRAQLWTDRRESGDAETTRKSEVYQIRQMLPMKKMHQLNMLASIRWSNMTRIQKDAYLPTTLSPQPETQHNQHSKRSAQRK